MATPVNKFFATSKRKSSLFDLQQLVKDKGESSISLSEEPNLQKKGIKIQFENTYVLHPDKSLNVSRIRSILKSSLEDTFKSQSYNHHEMINLSKKASQLIRDEVKKLEYHRYKVVCVVNVIQNNGQTFKAASRFLWDDKKDNWIDAYYQTPSFVAQAIVYTLYCE
ncbi:dynein light chain Tctex-type protein 2 [Hydra vulgaris]|uniref:Dynein light chain Tctex-type protein 2 n=1 Tax=Hydra vulgaris TaxID=6087 RepID=A0ABM4BAG5_HYDVU